MPDNYTPQTWANGSVGGTPINATRLQHIEDGINNIDTYVQTLGGGGGGGSTVFNVKAYGAIGDGSANDTAAIQAAIDAAEATVTDLNTIVDDGDYAGGGIVYFPPGRYRITSQLTVEQSNVWLVGDGPASRIVAGGAIGMLLIQGVAADEGSWLRRVAVKGLQFDGQGVATRGIGVQYAVETHIEDCYVYKCSGSTGPGIELIQFAFCMYVRRCSIRRNGVGIRMGNFSNNVSIGDCRIQHNNSHGIVTTDGVLDFAGVYIHGCDIEGNNGRGIYFGTGKHRLWEIIGCYFELNDLGNATVSARRDIELSSGTTADGVHIRAFFGVGNPPVPNYAVKIAAGQNIEVLAAAVGYNTAIVEVVPGVKRVRVCQSIDGGATPAWEYHGEDAVNTESARVRFKTGVADFTVGPGRPLQGNDGFGIFDKTNNACVIDWVYPGANGETATFLLYIDTSGVLRHARVKVGAPGTGPGGSGQALYIP